MSTINDQIIRISGNIAAAYNALIDKYNAPEPKIRNSDNLATTINKLKVADLSFDSNSGTLVINTK